jgi:hypothetical protein
MLADNRLANLVTLYLYGLVPILSFSFMLVGVEYNLKIVFDLCIVFFFTIAIFLSTLVNKRSIISSYFKLLILIGLFLLLYALVLTLISILYYERVYFFVTLMEYKAVLYLISCAFFLKIYGLPDKKYFFVVIRILCLLIIFKSIFEYFALGLVTRNGVLSEGNYDGYIVLFLFAYCLDANVRLDLLDLSLIVAATLLTQSKTGLIILFIFLLILSIRNKKTFFLMLLLIPIIFFAIFEIISTRIENFSTIASIDRFLMWAEYFELMLSPSVDLTNKLFGFSPGVPIKESSVRLWWFIENQSLQVGANGLHAFNFHSQHIRFLLTYGLFVGGFTLLAFFVFLLKMRMFAFLILFFLQGFSLGGIYLSIVTFLIVIYVPLVLFERKELARL